MKKTKRLLVMFMMVMTLATMYAGVTVSAAGNHTDSRFAIRYDGSGGDVATPTRGKWDYTSCYILNDKTGYDMTVCIWGADRDGGTGITQSADTRRHCCWGTWGYLSKVGKSMFMPNAVRERGYAACNLGITPGKHGEHNISILWSPDSV